MALETTFSKLASSCLATARASSVLPVPVMKEDGDRGREGGRSRVEKREWKKEEGKRGKRRVRETQHTPHVYTPHTPHTPLHHAPHTVQVHVHTLYIHTHTHTHAHFTTTQVIELPLNSSRESESLLQRDACCMDHQVTTIVVLCVTCV